MYTKENKLFTGISKLENYIDSNDVYNSKLLLLLSDPGIDREEYTILNFQYRPDLIAQEYYGDSSYLGLLLIQTARSLEDFKIGEVLHLIPKTTLDSILSNI